MKIPINRFLLLTAFGAISALSASIQAATIDLSGVVLKNGKNESRNTSPTTLPAAASYDYTISGTCHGTGNLASVIPNGTSIADALDTIDPGFSENLQGTVFNPTKHLPYTVVNKTFKGSKSFGIVVFQASAKLKVGITAGGIGGFSLTGVSFKVNNHPDPADTIVIEANSTCTVNPTPAPSATPQPDAIILTSANTGLGGDVYNTTGANQTLDVNIKRRKTKSVPVLIQNDGQLADTFTLSAPAAATGFKVQYFSGKTNITADVNAGTYQIANLASTDAKVITVKITPTSAHVNDVESVVLTATSTTTAKDTIAVTATAK